MQMLQVFHLEESSTKTVLKWINLDDDWLMTIKVTQCCVVSLQTSDVVKGFLVCWTSLVVNIFLQQLLQGSGIY